MATEDNSKPQWQLAGNAAEIYNEWVVPYISGPFSQVFTELRKQSPVNH